MISVCIATYNGERFIGQQLASILSQLGDGDEVVVSDDGSTDGTLSVVKAFNDSRVRIISGPCKGSLVLNFENALRAATGDFIFLADQDDVWADGKVAVCTERLRRYSCVVTDAVVTDGNLNITSPSFMRLNKTKPGKWYNLLVKNGYLGCCMAFRKEVLDAALPFPSFIPMHDIWIGNVAAFRFSVSFIGKAMVFFRRHGEANSSTARKSDAPLWSKIRFRLNVCRGLFRMKEGEMT